MINDVAIDKSQVLKWLNEIPDPEIPVVSIVDLGIVRDVRIEEHTVVVVITPTYTGCPATDMIAMQIRMGMIGRGVKNIKIESQLQPAWTTDWISDEGNRKMLEYGIVPPQRKSHEGLGLFEEDHLTCPRCQSTNTELVSQFGATACKALYRCLDCKEPFEHFKCH